MVLLSSLPMTPQFIRAAHYLADQWPLTFWSNLPSSRQIARDLQGIRADGFNTIILLLPTRIFAGRPSKLSDYHSAGLWTIVETAEKSGLKVILRCGYPHDLSPACTEVVPRLSAKHCLLLHQSEVVFREYLNHLDWVANFVCAHPNVIKVFTSWEDSWCMMKIFPELDLAKRRRLSERLGFKTFVRDELSEDLRRFFYSAGDETPPIPTKSEPHFVLYKMFYDHYVGRKFLSEYQHRFASFAYEQRVDMQKIQALGGPSWLRFATYADMDVETFSYWAPFMGAQNQGEKLSAEKAFEGLKRVVERVRQQNCGRAHFIDQFNFVNGTAEFVGASAAIEADQRVAFLERAMPYLRRAVSGYGVWAYRDYRQSCIVNGNFRAGLYGWAGEGVGLREKGDQTFAVLRPGSTLRQDVFYNTQKQKMHGYYGDYKLHIGTLELLGASAATLHVSLSGETVTVPLRGGGAVTSSIPTRYLGEPQDSDPMSISVEFDGGEGELAISGLQLYNHVLSNGLYSVDMEDNEVVRFMREDNLASAGEARKADLALTRPS